MPSRSHDASSLCQLGEHLSVQASCHIFPISIAVKRSYRKTLWQESAFCSPTPRHSRHAVVVPFRPFKLISASPGCFPSSPHFSRSKTSTTCHCFLFSASHTTPSPRHLSRCLTHEAPGLSFHLHLISHFLTLKPAIVSPFSLLPPVTTTLSRCLSWLIKLTLTVPTTSTRSCVSCGPNCQEPTLSPPLRPHQS